MERLELRGRSGYTFPQPIEDVELRGCRFIQWQQPADRSPADRPSLRRVTATGCHFDACDLGPVIAEDCTVVRPTFHRGIWGPQLVGGCALRHVTIRGPVTGSLLVTYARRLGPIGAAASDPFVEANRAFYQDVDWALDISEAAFTNVDMWRSDIPSDLVRRDPETQAIMRRKDLLDARWRTLNLPDPSAALGIERFLDSELPDTIIVASKRGKYFARERETIRVLRAEALAEPD